MRKIILVLAVLILIVCGCAIPEGDPSYVKDFVAYKEGYDNGVVIYFILANENGEMISANGRLNLSLKLERYDDKVYTATGAKFLTINLISNLSISSKDFHKATIGRGPFERKVILYSLGRRIIEKDENSRNTLILLFEVRLSNGTTRIIRGEHIL